MRVRMKIQVSGVRNGQAWPARGERLEVSDEEGASLCASGLAVPVESTDDDVEKAVPVEDSEKRSGGLTKATAGALTRDGSDEPKSEGDQATTEAVPAPAPAKKTAARKTAAKKATAGVPGDGSES